MASSSRRLIPSFLLGVAATLTAACGSGSHGDLDADLVRSPLGRETSPKASADDAKTLAADDTKFAFDLYHELDAGDNLVFSPYSVSIDLAMVYAGAAGATADAMRTALDFTLSPEALHAAFDSVDLALSSRQGSGGSGGPFQLSVANSLWVDETLTLEKPFLDTLAVDYGTGVHAVDFQNGSEEARSRINSWVSGKTQDKIQDLIPAGGVGRDTRLSLVNAIYFNAGWNTPFDEHETYPGPFHALDGTTTTANLMRSDNVAGAYAKGQNYAAAELRYRGDQSMVIILPDEGAFDAVETELDGPFVATVVASLAPTDLAVTLPRFTIRGSTIDLKEQLSKLGMSQAFTPDADFSAMTKTQVFLGDVFHQAFIQVAESGTVAGAATATTTRASAIEEGTLFTVDRPFIYLIRDVPTNAVLFVGREVNPLG